MSLGLAPIVVRQVYEAIPMIKAQGTTVLVVEQDVNQALAVADRFYCLLEGRIALSGVPGEVTKEQITEAYFGMSTAARRALMVWVNADRAGHPARAGCTHCSPPACRWRSA